MNATGQRRPWPPFWHSLFGGASSSVTSRTISWGSDRDVRSGVPPLRPRFRDGICLHLCDSEVQGVCAVHRLSFARHRPPGHAPFTRCRRSGFGFSRARVVLVRMDRYRHTRRTRDRLHSCAVTCWLVSPLLAGMGLGGSSACDDGVRLPDYSLVPAVGRLDTCPNIVVAPD